MKKLEFKINQLGAIRNSSIKIKPLMVLSGESGLGKSYAAFLVHYIYYLLSNTNNRLKDFFVFYKKYDFESIFANATSGDTILTISKKDVFDWINKDAITYIGYLIGNKDFHGDIEISFPCDYKDFEFTYIQELGGLEGEEEIIYKLSLRNFSYMMLSKEFEKTESPFIALLKAELKELLFGNFRDMSSTYLLPPSRGALMDINERPVFLSGMYNEFFDFKRVLNEANPRPEEPNNDIIECSSIVNEGKLKGEEGRIIYSTHGADMPLTAAASSIKELAPLTLFLNKYSTKGVSFLFEEPEAHLHPNRQIKVADMISCIVNEGGHMQITTHSDFLIKRLNNLINLFLLKDKMEEYSFKELLSKWNIKETYLLDPANVGAYLLKRNEDGTSQIVEQDIIADEEIPFESFYTAIEDDIALTRDIKTYKEQ
ncbi:hypothetical protein BWX39_03600 [Prevotella intermedia ATCC 25611 = DSM 20706]|uniref:AAA family ATPase n=1 Tax=Prevotella intermedia TaxID=28131 RepID=UPI000414C2F1|nr:AAA family ATPase [Prevotella intermedia]APW31806.1 hypothetical protein BWX39_03600 [Prevotella intermedia ATCC 25611 = DSM 20706]SUB96345.1 Uncharacterized conserved protein [Prevotella intermedia]